MRRFKAASSSSALIYFGLGLCVITLGVIVYGMNGENLPSGRAGTLVFVGIPVGLASIVTGVVMKIRERRR